MSLAGYILVAVSIGAFLGALTVLVAARRGAFGVAKRSTATGEPDAVDPVTPADVSVQLSALDETEKNNVVLLNGEFYEYMFFFCKYIYSCIIYLEHM
jgi:hypothetical protein